MQFPNAYQGVKRLFFSEILGIITASVSLLYGLSLVVLFFFSSALGHYEITRSIPAIKNILSVVQSGLIVFTALIRLLALGRAAQNEESFGKAQIANLICLLFAVLSRFIEVYVLGINVLEFAALLAWICATLYILSGIINLALRVRDAGTYDRGQLLKRMIWALIFSPFLFVLLAVIAKKSSSPILGIILILLALAFVVTLLVEFIMRICYLKRAENMLRCAKIEAYDPMGGVSSVFRPVDPDANPW